MTKEMKKIWRLHYHHVEPIFIACSQAKDKIQTANKISIISPHL